MRTWVPIQAVWISFLWTSAQTLPELEAVRTERPPVVDGYLEPLWEGAAVAGDFRILGTGKPASQETRVYLLYDDDSLYVAFRCREDRMGDIRARVRRHDGRVWEDDCVEVFLAPFPDTSLYFHFLVNVLGTRREEMGRDARWGMHWRAAVWKGEGEWTAEMAIPFRELGLTSEVGGTWRANFCREEYPHGELSTWSPCRKSFHEPESFGTISGLRLDFAGMAKGTLSVGIARLDSALGVLREELSPKLYPSETRLAVQICRAKKELALVREGLRRSRTRRQVGIREARYRALAEELPRLEREVALALLARKVPGERRTLGYALCRESPMVKVRPDRPYRGEPADTLRLYAALGEYEPAQVVVVAFGDSLRKVKAEISDLVGPGRIGGRNLGLRLVGFVRVREPSAGSYEEPGLFPDPLLPFEPFDLPRGEVRSLWLTVHVPEDARPGVYRGVLTVNPEDKPSTELPVVLRVWDFRIPRRPHLRNWFQVMPYWIVRWYGEERREEMLGKFRMELLSHRASPLDVASPVVRVEGNSVRMDWSYFDREIEFYLKHGLTGFNVWWARVPGGWGGRVDKFEDEGERRISERILRETERHLREKGWLDLAYVFVIDEPTVLNFPQVKESLGFVKEVAPGLRTQLTLGYGATEWRPGEEERPAYEDLVGYVDIWVPHIDCFHPEFFEERKAAGEEVWLYVCIGARHPYPNIWAIDYPGVEHRVLFWMLWKYGIQGFLYWAVNCWKVDVWKDPMSYPGGNGDGSLLYPGPEGPVPSLRWELVREGIEDYEYLYLLHKALGRKGLDPKLKARGERLLDVREICSSFTEYTRDPEVLEARRLEIGELLERLYGRGDDTRCSGGGS